jgi:glutamine cyclotransferase
MSKRSRSRTDPPTEFAASPKPPVPKPPVPKSPGGTAPPAWRNRIGLILAFFALTIGGTYLFMALMYSSTAQEFDCEIVRKYPHGSAAFTEGLVYRDGVIFESTGLLGKSTISKFDLATETLVSETKLDEKLFGEGLTLWDDRLLQLTYRNGVALWYDLELQPIGESFSYDGEGWGLTNDGQYFIMSNGSSTLQFRDPKTFEVVRRLRVTDGGRGVSPLNELEYVDGKIYANVWHRDFIVGIDPQTGQVTSRIYLNDLLPLDQRPTRESVLNGIAFNTRTQNLIVTGKNWPHLFEIKLVPRTRGAK